MIIHTSMHAHTHIYTYAHKHIHTQITCIKIGRNKTYETQKRNKSLRKEKEITSLNADFLLLTKPPVDTGYQCALSLKKHFFCCSSPSSAAAGNYVAVSAV